MCTALNFAKWWTMTLIRRTISKLINTMSCEIMIVDFVKINSSDKRIPRLTSDEYSSVFKHLHRYKLAGRCAAMRSSIMIAIVPSAILGSPVTFTAAIRSNIHLNRSKSPVQNLPLDVNGPVYTSMNGLRRFTQENTLYSDTFCRH